MKLFNYLRMLGAFTDGYQRIALPKEPSERAVRRMLTEGQQLSESAIARRREYVAARAAKSGNPVDEAQLAQMLDALSCKDAGNGTVLIPLQFVQDNLVRRLAAVQNNASIHSEEDVKEVLSVFAEYGVQTVQSFRGLTLSGLSWSEKPGQKPKVLVHAADADGEITVIRFEAAIELASKFLLACQALGLREGDLFDMKVEAVDPAIERNKRAGKQVAKLGVYVNHNMLVRSSGILHDGRPPKGERFVQKPTMEQVKVLFDTVASKLAREPQAA